MKQLLGYTDLWQRRIWLDIQRHTHVIHRFHYSHSICITITKANERHALRAYVLTCTLVCKDLHQRYSLLEDRDMVTMLFSVWYYQQRCKSPTLCI